jgi:autotransporter-associated beta strand protein
MMTKKMMTNKNARMVYTLVAWLALGQSVWSANWSVPVPGFSFESPVTGSYLTGNPDGWIKTGAVGVMNRTLLPLLSGVTSNQIAFVNNNASLWSAASLTAITSGVTYTLTVDAAGRSDFPSSGFKLQLYADSPASGGTLLAETAVIDPVDDNILRPFQLDYTASAGDPAIGKGLYVKLINISGSNQTDFDNVRLDLDDTRKRFTKDSAGTNLNAGASWLGGVVPDSGTVAVWDSNSLGSGLSLASDKAWYGIAATNAAPDINIAGAGKLTLGSGGIDLSVAPVNLTISNAIGLAANQTWAVSTGKQVTASGVISGSRGVTFSGGGSVLLNNTNSYTGGTTVDGGALVLNANPCLLGSLTIKSNGLVNATNTWSLGYVAGSRVDRIAINGGTLMFTGVGGTSASNITMAAGAITGIPFDWFTSRAAGTPCHHTLATLASATSAVISADVQLRLNSLAISDLTFDVAAGSVPNGVDLFVSGRLADGVSQGGGNIIKAGAGTLVLGNTNTYSGTMTVNAGTLVLNASSCLRNSLIINSNGIVNVTNFWSLGYVPGWRVDRININGGTLMFTGSGGTSASNITMTAGAITGIPFDWFTSSWGTPPCHHTLATLASSTSAVISADIILRLEGATSDLTFDIAAGSVPNGVDLLVSGCLADGFWQRGGNIIKTGAGTLVLGNTNTYGGTMTVNTGVLRLGVTNALNATHALNLAGGTLDAAASSNALGTLTISADSTIIPGSGALTFLDSSAQVWSGNLSVTGDLGFGSKQLRFGTNRNALTPSQLERIRIKGTPAGIDANGYLYKRVGTMIRIF